VPREIDLPNGWTPRHYQLPAWRYLQSGGKHAELIWHRRAGKDDICLHHAACAAMKRVAGYWHMLPQATQARKAIWSAVNPHTGKKRIDEAFPLALRKATREQEMSIEFLNGSTWQVVGSDNFNSLVGSTPAGIVYSEWALSNPAARAYLRPILAENGGWQLFITTPRGRNHAKQTFEAAQKQAGAFTQKLTAHETGVFSPEQLAIELQAYIDEFGPDMGQAMFDQEYMVSFDAAILGAVLGRWMTRARLGGRMHNGGVFDPDGASICVSSDLGFRDTCSWWFWQPRRDGFGLVGYLGGSGKDADDWIDELKLYMTERSMKLGRVWLPHDARNKTFATKHSPMERFLTAFGSDRVRVVPMTKISDRINAARRVVERCVFDESACADGVSGLESWHYEYDVETRTMSKEPAHDWASHPGDGFSYGAQMMEMEPPPAPTKNRPRFLDEMQFDEVMWPAKSARAAATRI
jgi:phage terminase large subunit